MAPETTPKFELLGPGGGGAEVEGPDLAGAEAEQLEAERGTDEALSAGHHEPQALDPLFALRCISSCPSSLQL
jgi:hypothetical protein